jgi:hypothetical protein
MDGKGEMGQEQDWESVGEVLPCDWYTWQEIR